MWPNNAVIIFVVGEYAWIISVVGNFITLFGAFWTARAVILTEQQADAISSVPYGGPHPQHAAALLAQSKAAKNGLYLVAGGTFLQSSASSSSISERRTWRWLRSTG